MDDLLQMIAARQAANVRGADPRAGVALRQHAQQLSDLIHVVARLPLRRGAREQLARRGERVHRAGRDAAPIALLPDDAEVAELEAAAVADEDVDRRQVAVQELAAVQFAEDLEDARNLASRGGLGPLAVVASQERAQIAVTRVLEREAVEHCPPRPSAETCRTRESRADGRRAAVRSTPRAASHRCVG